MKKSYLPRKKIYPAVCKHQLMIFNIRYIICPTRIFNSLTVFCMSFRYFFCNNSFTITIRQHVLKTPKLSQRVAQYGKFCIFTQAMYQEICKTILIKVKNAPRLFKSMGYGKMFRLQCLHSFCWGKRFKSLIVKLIYSINLYVGCLFKKCYKKKLGLIFVIIMIEHKQI